MLTLDGWIAALEDVAVEQHPDRLELAFPEGRVLVRWDERPAFVRVGHFGLSHAGESSPALLQRIDAVSETLREVQLPDAERAPPNKPARDGAGLRAVRQPELAAALDTKAGLAPGSFRSVARSLTPGGARGNKLVFRAATRVAYVFPTASWAARLARRQRALEEANARVPPLYAHGTLPGPMGYLVYGRVHEGLRNAAARNLGSVRFAGALGESLARFHRASEGRPAPPDEGARVALELARWPDLDRRAIAVRLYRHFADAAPRPRVTLVHTDVHPGNVLFDGASAWLVDLDAARTGDPMLDLASARATCVRDGDAWRALCSRYERVSGHRVETAHVDPWIALRALVALRDEPSRALRWRYSRALSAALARLGWRAL